MENERYYAKEFRIYSDYHYSVAELLKISVRNLGKKYVEIYASLGVENKNELVELCKKGMTEAIFYIVTIDTQGQCVKTNRPC